MSCLPCKELGVCCTHTPVKECSQCKEYDPYCPNTAVQECSVCKEYDPYCPKTAVQECRLCKNVNHTEATCPMRCDCGFAYRAHTDAACPFKPDFRIAYYEENSGNMSTPRDQVRGAPQGDVPTCRLCLGPHWTNDCAKMA